MTANDDCKTWTRMLINAKIIHCFLLASLAALHWINCKGLWIWSEDSTTREGIINLISTMLSLVYHWCISHIATTVPAKHSTQICVVVCYKFQLYWPIMPFSLATLTVTTQRIKVLPRFDKFSWVEDQILKNRSNSKKLLARHALLSLLSHRHKLITA